MNRGVGISLIIALIVLIPLLSDAATRAELESQIEATRREQEELTREQRRLEAELAQINAEKQTLGSAVKSLDTTKKKLENDIKITQSKVKTSNLRIEELENSIGTKNFQISVHKNAIGNVLATIRDYDSRSLVVDILGSSKLSDIWEDERLLSDLSGHLESEINVLRDTQVVLGREKTEREKTAKELSAFERQLSGQKQVVEENQNVKTALLRETQNKESEYQKQLRENIERQEQFEDELFRLESELRITLDPSLFPPPRAGILSWPLDDVYITQRFGVTEHSQRLYRSGTHNGVDFRAPVGTPVKAMLTGVVENMGNTDSQRGCYSFGRWIFLRHDNGLSTVYAHLSASLVEKGQKVEKGEVIGYSGGMPGADGAGYSTGPHLHVGLYSSQGVEVRQFVTSINCKQVFVPIADVRAYLDPLAYLPRL